jgi:3-hydroxyacyl-CoA dehydrogenase
MKRIIKKVAVVGSGIMGSGIACHLANIGLEVVLLDIVPILKIIIVLLLFFLLRKF